jgi:hypothetical protein
MSAKIGDRVDLGSAIEPCGGVLVSMDRGVAIIRWDSGGECVTTEAVQAVLGCGRSPMLACPAPIE